MKKTKFKNAVVILFMVLAVAAAAQAEEQKKPNKEEAVSIETITVSAQKREQDVQDVPVSVGVLSDIRLEEERVTKLYDLDRIIPNLYMANAGGGGTFTYLGIRGRINGDADVDPTVTVLIDGVPYDDFYSMGNNLLYDIERVEVLRGPQSTMYGLNSIAGVINIVTKKPDNNFRAKVYSEASAGPDWEGSWQVGGTLSGPLMADRLYGTLSFLNKNTGGYVENLVTGDQYNSDQTTGLKGDLRWTPGTAWDITLGLAYTKYDGDFSETYLPTTEAAAAAVGTTYEEWQANTDWEGDSEVETWAPNLRVTYDAGAFTIASISAYRDASQEFDFDPYLSPSAGYLGYISHEAETFTQEFRLQSNEDENSNLEWLGGYAFNDFERHEKLGWGLISNPENLYIFKDSTLNGTSHAFFGQATWRFLEKALGVTLGARQEWTEREAQSALDMFREDSVDDSQFLPKLALDYRISDDVMAYSSVAKGWRCGGMNLLASSTEQSKYGKETSWTYEMGIKTKLFNNRATFNASVFYSQYKNYQDLVYVQPGTAYLANAPEVRMTGFETELETRLSKDLLLTASFGWVNAEYEDFPDATNGNYDGNKVMFVPDFDASIALKYSFLEHFYIRPEIQGVGNLYWDRANTQKQSPYALFNFKAGYVGKNYEIYLFGENLANKYAFSQATDYLGSGNYYGTPITPLRVGIGVTFEF